MYLTITPGAKANKLEHTAETSPSTQEITKQNYVSNYECDGGVGIGTSCGKETNYCECCQGNELDCKKEPEKNDY